MTRHRGVKASLQGYRAPLSRCTLSRPPRDDEPGGVSLLPSPLPYACPKAVVTQKYVEQQVYEIFRLGGLPAPLWRDDLPTTALDDIHNLQKEVFPDSQEF